VTSSAEQARCVLLQARHHELGHPEAGQHADPQSARDRDLAQALGNRLDLVTIPPLGPIAKA
jgi:hypothetical protein